MKLSSLLAHRKTLQRKVQLSNLAHAYERLACFHTRILLARLQGEVHLEQAAPEREHFQATLTALEGNQSVIEEHFTERDLMDLVDAVAYASGETNVDLRFDLREVGERFLKPLRRRLEQAGVEIDQAQREQGNNDLHCSLETHNLEDENESSD